MLVSQKNVFCCGEIQEQTSIMPVGMDAAKAQINEGSHRFPGNILPQQTVGPGPSAFNAAEYLHQFLLSVSFYAGKPIDLSLSDFQIHISQNRSMILVCIGQAG